jgi:hypothetical protein
VLDTPCGLTNGYKTLAEQSSGATARHSMLV